MPYSINKKVVVRELKNGGLIVYFAGSSSFIQLDEVGSFVWGQLRNPATKSELVVSLLKGYDVDEPTAEQDVQDFLNELLKLGLLKKLD